MSYIDLVQRELHRSTKPKNIVNAKPHFVPLHPSVFSGVLQSTKHSESATKIYDYAVNLAKSLGSKHTIDIIPGKGINFDGEFQDSWPSLPENSPALVYSNGKLQGIAFRNYDSASRSFVSNISKQFLGSLSTGRITTEDGSSASPAVRDVLDRVDKILMLNAIAGRENFNLSNADRAQLNNFIKEYNASKPEGAIEFDRVKRLQEFLSNNKAIIAEVAAKAAAIPNQIHAELTAVAARANKQKYDVLVETAISKEVSKELARLNIQVAVIQDSKELQVDYGRFFSQIFVKKLTDEVFSSEKVLNNVVDLVTAALLGKSKLPIAKSTKKLPAVSRPKRLKPPPKLSTAAAAAKAAKAAKKVPIPKLVQSFSPLALNKLIAKINLRLHDRIKANMGTGDRRDILNYRTGRFAHSAIIERYKFSKDTKEITTYFTYMKDPYSTFSVGGAQSIPRSRDPVPLIARSIKEVAREIITNRLKTILV